MLHFLMLNRLLSPDRKGPSRRAFLRFAPFAAASLPLTDTLLLGAPTAPPSGPAPFQLFPAAQLSSAVAKLHAAPGNDPLVDTPGLPLSLTLTSEEKKTAKEFEVHEGRDHVLQIIDGSTVYELGGTLQGARNIRPGEWLAPACEGATSVTLNKGDMLVIPRGTPHKRSTAASVTFLLIIPFGKS